ncbi:MAG: hypothetical protein ACFE8U_06340 [Candidatus Hermodarchaeota archaeon]
MIKIVPFFSPIFSSERRKEILSQLFLDDNQIVSPERYFSEDYSNFQTDQHYIFVGTGGTEKEIADFVKQSKLSTPIILLSYELHNSLPAAMETRSYLEQEKIESRITHDHLTELTSTFKRLKEYNAIKDKLDNSRMGIIGEPSEWLIASQIDENKVKENWGITFVSIPIKELLSVQEVPTPTELDEFSDQFINKATDSKVSSEEVVKAAIVFDRLNQLAKQFQLDAVTVECFSLVQETSITSCYALSLLNDEGIVAGCEGDIPSTFTMLLLFLLVDNPVFMANVIDVNTRKNSIKLAHCTVPTKIIENYAITTHFETGKSVAIRGQFKTAQEVTILKIGGKDLTHWWVTRGKIISIPENKFACRTQIEVSINEPVRYFLEESIANHHCIVRGNHVERIQEFLDYILEQ